MQRVLAINETMMVDSKGGSGPTASDEIKPFFDRQTALAALVGDMMAVRKSESGQDHIKATFQKAPRKKTQGGLSRSLIEPDASKNTSTPRGIVVPPKQDAERRVDVQVDTLRSQQDERAERYEQSLLEHGVSATVAGVQKFLNEALATKASTNLLRKANLLANNKVGRNAGFGWALEDLLKETGSNDEEKESKSPKKKKTVVVPVKSE